jgi:membrane protease YdiL (CAAX protease family)
VAGLIAKALGLTDDPLAILTTACAQIGMLAGAWLFWSRPERGPPRLAREGGSILVSGTATFLISLPALLLAAKVSDVLLDYFDLPTEHQNLVGMFVNADSGWLLAIMILLAVIMAPLAEELVFRAGIFRYLRSRIPRWLALVGSALLFASLHVNWKTYEGLNSLLPLVVLAVMFSLAYERTGSIGTSIVAHALFNLNTIMLIFSGVGT